MVNLLAANSMQLHTNNWLFCDEQNGLFVEQSTTTFYYDYTDSHQMGYQSRRGGKG